MSNEDKVAVFQQQRLEALRRWNERNGIVDEPAERPKERAVVRHVRDNYIPSDLRRHYTFGVDFGQTRDFTAMAVLEQRWKMATPEEFQRSAGRAYHGEYVYTVVKLARVELGTPYTDIADWVREEVNLVDDRLKRTVVIDGTGVGTAVRDVLRTRGLRATLVNTVITGGEKPGYREDGRATYVARTELMSRLAVAVENGEFSVDARCKEQDRLARELAGLRRRGKPAGGDTDDLAFALALAVWWGIKR